MGSESNRLPEQDRTHLLAAVELAARAREHGNHPFGSLLANASGQVVLTAENTVVTDLDITGHAELNLVRKASQRWTPDQLRHTTLYSSTEPCAMCASGIFVAGIGRVVYALDATQLHGIVAQDPNEIVLDLPCRTVFAAGGDTVEVSGPHLHDEAAAVHVGFWR